MPQFPLFTILSLQFPKKLEAFARFHVKDNDSDLGETHSVPLTQMGWVAKSHMPHLLSADSEELSVGAWQRGEGAVCSPRLGCPCSLPFLVGTTGLLPTTPGKPNTLRRQAGPSDELPPSGPRSLQENLCEQGREPGTMLHACSLPLGRGPGFDPVPQSHSVRVLLLQPKTE